MKGYIIEDTVCNGPLGYVHGQFFSIKRIVVDGMVITVHGDELYAISEEDFDEDREDVNFIEDIEIDDNIIDKVRDYMKMKEELIPIKKTLEDITNGRND